MAEETTPSDAAAIGQMIHAARRDRGWSAAELGERIGRPVTTVVTWEQGRAAPDDEVISSLAAALELDARDLVAAAAAADELAGPDSDAGGDVHVATTVTAAETTDSPTTRRRSTAWRALTEREPDGGPTEDEPVDGPSGAADDRPLDDSPDPAPRPEPLAFGTIEAVRADREPELPSRPDVGDSRGVDLALLAQRAVVWVRDRWRRRRILARAPTSVKSYVEDDRQATTYRIRLVLTAIVLVVLILVLRWAWTQFAEAVTSLFDTLRTAV